MGRRLTLSITLSDGTTTIPLPPDLDWIDEFEWSPVARQIETLVEGDVDVQESLRSGGRPITLQSGNGAVARRHTVEAIEEMLAVPGKVYTLSLWGVTYGVTPAAENAFSARQVLRLADAPSDWPYFITLRFLEMPA